MNRTFLSITVLSLFGVIALNDVVTHDLLNRHKEQEYIPVSQIKVDSMESLFHLYEKHRYSVDDIRQNTAPVPKIYLASVPKDIKSTKSELKKDTFVQIMLPLILEVNQQINKDRERLMSFKDRMDDGGHLTSKERHWLMSLAEKYRTKSANIDHLLERVDVIPPSLALGQASLESGWGMSPAARKANSTFGVMSGKTKVKPFDNLYDNVELYVLNLNRHEAYKELRKIRAEMRKEGKELCSITLCQGLKKYSTRGKAYIRDLQNMIKKNDFLAFDGVNLDS